MKTALVAVPNNSKISMILKGFRKTKNNKQKVAEDHRHLLNSILKENAVERMLNTGR